MEFTDNIIEQIRIGFRAGRDLGFHEGRDIYSNSPLSEDEYIESLTKLDEDEDEETISVSLKLIKNTCGWSEFAEATGTNPYMLNEFTVEDSEKFEVTVSIIKQLRIL